MPDLSFEMKKSSPKVVSNPQSRKGHVAKMAGAGHRRHCIKEIGFSRDESAKLETRSLGTEEVQYNAFWSRK